VRTTPQLAPREDLEYRYHYNALVYAVSQAQIDTIARCIKKTVADGHPEWPILEATAKKRRLEIEQGLGKKAEI
jgi:hypothetical protein